MRKSTGRRGLPTLPVLLATVLFCTAAVRAQVGGTAELMLILDASGSMWGQIDGENKIVIARQVMRDLVRALADGSEVGLVAYGHRREADCADVETVLPMGPLDRSSLSATVDGLNPKGKTPITAAVEHAIEAVRARDTGTTVILVSDGLETCGGDPCAAVQAAKEAGVDFRFHVVGFDVAGEDVSSLECAAQAGEGLYFSADNAEDLAAALNQAVNAPTEVPEGRLSVKVTANGELEDASVRVFPAGSRDGEALAGGRTYTSEGTNPRLLPVDNGTYDVWVQAVGIRGASRWLEAIEVREGEITEEIVDFSSGEVAVKVSSNGALSDATVSVIPEGAEQRLAGGRTYSAASSNPQILEVPAGTYRVEVATVDAKGYEPTVIESVEVLPGQRTDVETSFDYGTVKLGCTSGADLVDCVVGLVPVGETRRIAGGRTYTSSGSNPRALTVPPGTYEANLKALGREDGERRAEIVVEAGQTTEHIEDYRPTP